MTETLFEAHPLTPEEAAAKGYIRLHVELGDPALAFSTYVRKDSRVLPRHALDEIAPAGVRTLATICVPEAREVFLTNVDAFVFEQAIEAQPCANHALVERGFVPFPETGQSGLLIGGTLGILTENGEKARAARSPAVVRGRTVLVFAMEFPFAGSDAALEETGVFVANLAFDQPEATRFLRGDVTTLELPLPGEPFALTFPSNLTVTLNSFPEEEPEGVVLFALGDPKNAFGLMTFGFRQSATEEDAATLDAWATRVAEQYTIQNPTIFGRQKMTGKAVLAKLEGFAAANASYAFRSEHLGSHRQNQTHVMVVADGNDRYTFSTMAIAAEYEDFRNFLVYAACITAHEMMVDSLFRRLTGSGF